MKLYYLPMLVALIGCASSKQTVMPDGQQGHSINCSGSFVSMNSCYEKAGELCPYGYDIYTKDESGGWVATTSFAGSTSLKGILVRCKNQQAINAKLMKDVKGCVTNEDCEKGKVCATVGGELPGSCAKTGYGF